MKTYLVTIPVIFLLVISANFAIDIHVPAMPIIVSRLHISVTSAQLTMGIFFLAYAMFPLLFGILSDGYGRRNIVVIALCILMMGSIICTFASSALMLLTGRFIQGAGAGGCAPLSSIILRDRYEAEQMARVASFMGIAIEFTLALSPAIGGFLVHSYGWRSNFIFIVILAFLVLLIVISMFKETSQHHHKSNTKIIKIIQNSREILSHRKFQRFSWCATAGFCSAMAYFTISPFVIQTQLHYSAKVYGLMSLYVTGGIVLGSWINAILIRRVGSIRLIYVGLFLVLISGIGLLLISLTMPITLFYFILLSAIVFLGLAFLFGNCMSGAFEPFKKQAGIAGSLYRTIQISMTFIVTLIISLSSQDNSLFLSFIYIISSCIALWNFYRLRE